MTDRTEDMKRVLAVLIPLLDDAGRVRISTRVMAHRLGISRNRVVFALDELVRIGLVERRRTVVDGFAHGAYGPNEYTIKVPGKKS